MSATKKAIQVLEEEKAKLTKQLCNGLCGNFAEYKELAGRYRATVNAIQVIHDATHNLELEDEEIESL